MRTSASRAAALAAGFVFGVGVLVARMTDPAKVRAFLDVMGTWDPSLAFVMIGAITVHFVLLRGILRRSKPVFAQTFQAPPRRSVDGALVGGAAVFGVGWGLGGVCPGPGLVDAAAGSAYAIVFVSTMLLGSLAGRSVKATIDAS